MYLKQQELFAGLEKGFVREIFAMTEKKTYRPGDVIFVEGNHANRFYVLVKGRVRLTVGEGRQVAFMVNHAGEAFGWSSLLGRSTYAASAVCEEPTVVMRIDRVRFNMVLDRNPASGLALLRRLANMLGHRLHEAYRVIGQRAESFESYGSGQTMEATPAT
jgi:CRP-like cAMP-binding protein